MKKLLQVLKDPGSALTHFIGMTGAVIAAVPLLVKAARESGPYRVVALAVFIVSMILLYAASTVFSKLAAGEPFLSPRFILYYGLVLLLLGVYALGWQQVIRRLRPLTRKREIELIMDPYEPVEADIDVTKLSLAFSNLIENGIKYNKDGGWVRVSLKNDAKYFYVNVSDSGMGIPQDQIEHIFERFYRGDKSHSTEIEGTGLGLAITKSAILLHRGVIKVTSNEGEGSVFMVRIPIVHEE